MDSARTFSRRYTTPLIFMDFPAPYAKAPPHARTRSPYIPAATHTHPQSPCICIPSMPTPCPPRPARVCGRLAQASPVAGTERRTYSHTSPVTAPASRHRAARRCMPAWGRAPTSPAARGADPLGTLGLRTPWRCDTKGAAALSFRVSLAGCHWSLVVLCESSDVSSFFSPLFIASCSLLLTPRL